jgi:hypothetical protein
VRIFQWLLLGVVIFGMVGCATLINQDTQPIVINTRDLSVNVTVAHKNGIESGATPFVASVRRANQPLVISVAESKCTEAVTIEKNATVSSVFFVNGIWCFSCVFSTTTDAATGRMWEYDEQIVVPVTSKPECEGNS